MAKGFNTWADFMYIAFAHREESRGLTCGPWDPLVRGRARGAALPAISSPTASFFGDGTSSARLRGGRRVDWWASRRGLMTGGSRRRAAVMGTHRTWGRSTL